MSLFSLGICFFFFFSFKLLLLLLLLSDSFLDNCIAFAQTLGKCVPQIRAVLPGYGWPYAQADPSVMKFQSVTQLLC